MGRVRGGLDSESLDSLPIRVPTWTFQLKPYIKKKPSGHESQGLYLSSKLQTHTASLLTAPAPAPCAEYQGSSLSSGFSRF